MWGALCQMRQYLGDERIVRRRQLVTEQFARMDPDRLLTTDQLRLPCNVIAKEWVQPDGGVWIVVQDDREGESGLDFDVEFFPNFAHEAFVQRFAGVDLAAGELPIPPKDTVGEALTQQDLPAA